MRKLDVSAATSTIGFPVKKGTWEHLQAAYKEIAESLFLCNLGDYDPTKVYVIDGVEFTSSGGGTTYDVSEGWLFYNGEIYHVDAITLGNPTGGNTFVAHITTTQYSTADPVTFTDLTPRDIHNIEEITFSIAAPGSGISDQANFINLLKPAGFTENSTPTTIKFDKNIINCDDIQIFPTNVAFDFDFAGARVGCRVIQVFSIEQTQTHVSVSNVPGDHIAIMSGGYNNSFNLSDADGDRLCAMTFEYLGQETPYGNHLIKVSVHKRS